MFFFTSVQDQVDTLTFQNRSLRDRAKRFEEALRRSTDEQIVVTAAPLYLLLTCDQIF